MMTKTQIVQGMLDLLDSPEKWTKGKSATDKDGNSADYYSSNAVSWCLAGAFGKVANLRRYASYPDWVEEFRGFLSHRCLLEHNVVALPEVNDYKLKDYEDMRMFLKRALLEAEELDAK